MCQGLLFPYNRGKTHQPKSGSGFIGPHEIRIPSLKVGPGLPSPTKRDTLSRSGGPKQSRDANLVVKSTCCTRYILNTDDTVDGSETGDHQLRLVVYSIIYEVFIHLRWLFRISEPSIQQYGYDLPPCCNQNPLALKFLPSGGSPCLIAGSKRFDSSNDSEELHLHKGRTVWDSCIFGEAVKKVMENSSMTFFLKIM